jgi:hypothetical protein
MYVRLGSIREKSQPDRDGQVVVGHKIVPPQYEFLSIVHAFTIAAPTQAATSEHVQQEHLPDALHMWYVRSIKARVPMWSVRLLLPLTKTVMKHHKHAKKQ